MHQDVVLVHFAPRKALAALALGVALSIPGTAHAVVGTMYGFEDGLTGDWNPPITNVPSGGGVLGVPSMEGIRHAELTNVHDSYLPGYGGEGFSYFGLGSGAKPYTADFYQSIGVYIDPTLNSAVSGVPGFWIDMSPSNNTTGTDTRAEHSFRITTSGTSAAVTVDSDGPGATLIATLSVAGWYNFEFTYEKGATGTDPVLSDAFVKDSSGTVVLGSVLNLPATNGGVMPSSDLGGEGYVWFPAWLNGYSGDRLAIDCIQSAAGEDLQPCPEPATLALLGFGLVGLGFSRRKRA